MPGSALAWAVMANKLSQKWITKRKDKPKSSQATVNLH